MSMLDAALQYAGRGWKVFPLHTVADGTCSCVLGANCGRNAGKHPRIRGGFRGATQDRPTIEGWWRKWPEANIGLATGSGDSGPTVLDIDGPAGYAELQALIERNGPLPDTLMVKTGNGAHLYWAGIPGARSSAHGHLHVRAEGGYVVAPPSWHRSGTQYHWINTLALGRAPEWLQTWILAGGSAARPRIAKPSSRHPGDLERIANPPGVADSFDNLGEPPAWVLARTAPEVPQILPDIAARALEASSSQTATLWSAHEEARLRAALACVPAHLDGRTWHNLGRALHDLHWDDRDRGNVGFDIWLRWSETSGGRGDGLGEFRGEADLQKRWASFGNSVGYGKTVTVASIYRMALDAGWDGTVPLITAQAENVSNNEVNGVSQEAKIPGFANGVNSSAAAKIVRAAGPGAIIFRDTDKAGNPKATCVNTRLAIRGLGLACEHDQFHDRFRVGGQAVGDWAGELTDNAVHALRGVIHQVYGFDPGTVHCYDATVQECLSHGHDPVREYLDGLGWDGVPRLGTWLSVYLGADDTPVNRAFGGLVLVAAVRRARRPGTKFDQILVLETPEGRGKSSAIEILAGPDNFSDQTILTLDDRGQQEAVQGVWLYEIGDLAGMNRAEVERVKTFASRTRDRARPAYGRSRLDRPRRCIFVGTTNDDTYLASQTGNRRFWPVGCGTIDLKALERDRDQLWGEAAALEAAGVPLGLPERFWADATELQSGRRERDPWDDAITDMTPKTMVPSADGRHMEWRISTRDVIELWIRVPLAQAHYATYKRVAYAMRRHGWSGPRLYRDGNKMVRGYIRKVPGSDI